jgi:site-specific DNA-methyltransferase (adenine-specific)
MACLDDFQKITVGAATVFHGSNLDVLPFMADNSVDSIVCDPPYELGFMGKSWDSSGIAYSVDLWRECLRVLKPGGHLLAFSGSRTYHRMVVAIEDAGFEVRDMISWISNKTFPKSMNISLAIDKAAGLQKDRGTAINVGGKGDRADIETSVSVANGKLQEGYKEPKSDDAKKWAGWGTALKPTVEPVVLARKPVDGTIAENVLAWGVGGLNIDASRIGTDSITINTFDNGAKPFGDAVGEPYSSKQVQGRWPANVIFDEDTAGLLDEQSGVTKSPQNYIAKGGKTNKIYSSGIGVEIGEWHKEYGDSGGASRFFYVAKASKRDRNEGLEELPKQMSRKFAQDETTLATMPFGKEPVQNFHPTVKPTDLMRYLIKLVTPAGGIVLDPFTGSGSTGKAALLDGYQFVGIELTADYLPIIEGRLRWADQEHRDQVARLEAEEKETLF